jgi:uncharacterized protein (TIGR03435 family)
MQSILAESTFLAMMAYSLRSFQLAAPAWMDTVRYNVVARIPPGADRRQFGLMQQNLLAERFGLQVHFEKKDTTVYLGKLKRTLRGTMFFPP